MFKFADKNVDISSDHGYKSLQALLSGGIKDINGKKIDIEPEALKGLDILESGDLDYISDGDFALIYEDKEGDVWRRYPMASFDDALVSALYLLKNKDQIPCKAVSIAASNLHKYLNSHSNFATGVCEKTVRNICHALWDLEDMCGPVDMKGNVFRERDEDTMTLNEQVRRKIYLEKDARKHLSPDDYVFSSKNGNLFPVNNKENLLKQAEYFEKNERRLPLWHRHLFAKKLRDKSASLGVKIAAVNLSKYASNAWSPSALDCVQHRIRLLNTAIPVMNEKTGEVSVRTKNTPVVDKALVGFIKLSKLMDKMNIDEFAETLYQLDKVAGFDKMYGKTVRDPFDSTYAQAYFFGPVEKRAFRKVAFGKINFGGQTFDANKLMSLDIGDLGGMIDEDTFDELKNDPVNVFNSLPLPYKSVIIDAIKSF